MGAKESKVAPARDHIATPPLPPGGGAPLFTGVRVVELATMVAAPSAGRLLAELGAEVIKVECPGGDNWRYVLRQFEKGREKTHSAFFEACNMGKSSVVMDINDGGMADLRRLLGGADVFITNLRSQALEKLSLDYNHLQQDFPGLIFGHITAWGRSGPMSTKPGYDIGAFWNMTGMSASLTIEGQYTNYPAAFGDLVTGTTLVAGIAAALANRTVTGRGMLVDSCLLRTGAYVMQAEIADAVAAGGPISDGAPQYNCQPKQVPTYSTYKCGDGKWVSIMGTEDTAGPLAAAVGASEVGLPHDVLQEKYFSRTTTAELLPALAAVRIPHLPMGTWPEDPLADREVLATGAFFTNSEVDDIPHFSAAPVVFGCSAQHGARLPHGFRRAPHLGEQTTSVMATGWAPRDKAAEPPKLATVVSGGQGPLGFLDVLELGDDVCTISCGSMLREYGARVTSLDFQGRMLPVPGTLVRQLRRAVDTVRVQRLGDVADKLAALTKAAAAAGRLVAFCVNWPLGELRDAGLHPEKLRETYPNLVIAAVSPLGIAAGDAARGDIGWWMRAAGLYTGLKELTVPLQFGALFASMHLLTGVCAAAFHARRTGEGQIVDLSYARSGAYAMCEGYAFYVKSPEKRAMLTSSAEEARKYFPVPTCLCHRTKDGYWIQLLGVDLGRHLMKLLRALGIAHTNCTVGCGFLCCCRCNCCQPGVLNKVKFSFDIWNTAIADKIGAMTREELGRLFEERDVWYCDVVVPRQVASMPQLLEAGAFDTSCADVPLAVRAPMRLEQCDPSASTRGPPITEVP